MRIHQRTCTDGTWTLHGVADAEPDLVLAFSTPALLAAPATWRELRGFWPRARIVACSTAGEIVGAAVTDGTIACTALRFERARIAIATAQVDADPSAEVLGERLAAQLPADGLVHVLVFSDGLQVNGSALIAGLLRRLPPEVAITGGLSGDGTRFERTAVCVDGPEPSEQIVAIGLYGADLRVGYGSLGGWDPFGVERRITRSAGNVLYELDGEPVLDLYKRYLDKHAQHLPASGLLFPLAIRADDSDRTPIVRTILSVDEDAKTLTFAGDMPLGHRARLMKSNVERLIDGAHGAGVAACAPRGAADPDFALLISCVGRKLVLKQRVEEEVEAAREAFGTRTVIAGFYSYGELSPSAPPSRCELHNQTMTVTTFSER